MNTQLVLSKPFNRESMERANILQQTISRDTELVALLLNGDIYATELDETNTDDPDLFGDWNYTSITAKGRVFLKTQSE